VSRLQM